MREVPAALLALNPDVSGEARALHEKQLARLAVRLGHVVVGTVIELPADRATLAERIRAEDVDAIVVPSLGHGIDILTVIPLCDVITANPEETYQRWVSVANSAGGGGE